MNGNYKKSLTAAFLTAAMFLSLIFLTPRVGAAYAGCKAVHPCGQAVV